MEKIVNYVLDACALLAYLKKETEGVKVKELFDKADAEPGETVIHISIVNLVEVYYGFIQEKGIEEADRLMKQVDDLPFNTIDTITDAVYRVASRFKALYSVSLADAFAAATAKSLSATVVTKDGEFEALEKSENLSVMWIKEPPQKS
jgi:predicted nucleic acid-binding protein